MRLFIAATFPEEVLRDLNDRVTRLRPRLPAASWVRPESQHLTFAFLGEQPESAVETLASRLAPAIGAVARFEARLHASGFFPNPRRARVGWVGLEPERAFGAVATAVRDGVQASGVTFDAAEFKAHLTVMRIKDPWPPASIELFTQSLRGYTSEPFAVQDVTLFSSELHPKGAIHTALRRFECGDGLQPIR
ncbi:MAG TPA: RNA 2',3'-cyclic phosphodiesterase [Thermoanaerobaculia bacterium]|nr:RNA 2',3'-cyclic phosphodiesterase [Thermoanaerobaculia bacterium]